MGGAVGEAILDGPSEHEMGARRTPPPIWGPRFARIRTADAPERERFDYWRSLFPGVDMQPVNAATRRPYDAENLFCAGDDGVIFAHTRSDATASRFIEGEQDYILISLLTAGGVDVEHGRGRRDRVTPGHGLTLLDCARPAHTLSGAGHTGLHLSAPRGLALAALGPDPAGREDAFRALPASPLAALLQAHLRFLAGHGESLAPAAAARLMQATSSVAMALLEQAGGSGADESRPDHHLFAAAMAYIQSRLTDPALCADGVARALCCSRSRLYRAFRRRDMTVGACIWEQRLLRSRRLLRDPRLSVGDAAIGSGYGDLPAFSKAFRRRFGISPRNWRDEALFS